jgi:hypothetical protein
LEFIVPLFIVHCSLPMRSCQVLSGQENPHLPGEGTLHDLGG